MPGRRPVGAHVGGKGDGQEGTKDEAGSDDRMRAWKKSSLRYQIEGDS